MRPIVLLLAACLCAILYHDPVASPYLAAAPPSTAATPSHETRLEQLQHYQVASQLLEMELAKYHDLRKAELIEMAPEVFEAFRRKLSKDLQPTWDRMRHFGEDYNWRHSPARTGEEMDKENANRELLNKQVNLFRESLQDARTADAKAWGKQFENRPSEKEIRLEEELISLFTRERDEARAGLK
jgi:hypothetical protein